MANDDLKELPDPTGFLAEFIEWKQTSKFRTTYVENLLKGVDEHDMVYPHYNVVKNDHGGTVTGRITMTDPPVQTFPKHMLDFLDSRFGTAGKLVKADLSQIELRVIADLSQDTLMLEAYQTGQDLHRQTASILFGKKIEDVTDDERKVGKVCNFAMIYGCSPSKLQEILKTSTGMDITFRQAKEFISKFYKSHHWIAHWQARIIKLARKKGCVFSPTGRVRYFPQADDDSKEGEAARRSAINFPIQSGAADIASRGMYNLWLKVRKHNIFLVANIYDAIFADVPLEHLDFYYQQAHECLEDRTLFEDLGWNITVPLKVEIEGEQVLKGD
jgi:DNA polymerase-1